MLAAVGIISVLSGAGLACTSRRFPAHVRTIEIIAGLLVMCGLALASCTLPVML